ncbi:GGDEF domain-containing protein [Shewanella halifaxensis]|uniref:GGDEF domain-containing protein n=1 Tax=Shewanella halifaxensis TaxID=271098 RepID=UPI000D58E752|nr:GGDEF domain-containing protein [Shewanella halifaxensis]
MYYNVYQPIFYESQVVYYEVFLRKNGIANIYEHIESIVNKPLFDYENILRIVEKKHENTMKFMINIHPDSLLNKDFVSRMLTHSALFNWICFELTEQEVSSENVFNLVENLNVLKKAGAKFALDDFGAKFSNMNRLISFDFDFVKIDKCFLQNISKSYFSFNILVNLLTSIINCYPDAIIIIEGIENDIQANYIDTIEKFLKRKFLRQGFYYGYPVEKTDVSCSRLCIDKSKIQNKKNDIWEGIYNRITKNVNADADIELFSHIERGALSDVLFEIENMNTHFLLKNNSSDIIYNNKISRDFLGITEFSIGRSKLSSVNKGYIKCIESDNAFVNSNLTMNKVHEIFDGKPFNVYRINITDDRSLFLSVISADSPDIYRDYLTGFYTRHDYNSYEWMRTISFLDLDNLKALNDNKGYEYADEMIKKFSRSLRTNLRESDVIVRHGGDEFIVFHDTLDISSIEKRMKIINRELKGYIQFSYGISFKEGSIEDSISNASRIMQLNKKAK